MNEYRVVGEGAPAHQTVSGTDLERTCILVLGMHRSGTSAFARVLSLLGAALPKNLLGAGPGNEKGHWEPEPLVTLHDRVLAALGSRWDDWRKLDFDSLSGVRQASIRDDLARLIEEQYGPARLLALKEPRICRFVPLYREVLTGLGLEPRCVMPLRNPLAVIASLEARNGMTQGFASLLWLRHALEAEVETRAWPRALVSYEALLADWRYVARLTARRLGLAWPRPLDEAGPEIGTFLSAEHQHHAPSRRELAARGDVADWVKETYTALLRLEQDPDEEAAFARLDRIRAEFDAACPAFGAAMFGELAVREAAFGVERGRLVAEAAGVRAALSMREGDLAQGRAELAARDERLGALQATLSARDERLGALQTTLSTRDERLGALEEALGTQARELSGLRDEVAARDRSIAELQDLLHERDGQQVAFMAELAGRQRQIDEVAAELSERKTAIAALNGDLRSAEAATRSHLAQLESERRRVAEQAAALEKLARDKAVVDARHASLERELAEGRHETTLAGLRASEVAAEAERAKAELNARKIEVTTLRTGLAAQAAELAKIYGSKSWRLTSPLRGTMRMFRGEVSAKQTFYYAAQKLFRAAPISNKTKHSVRHAVRKPGELLRRTTRLWFGSNNPTAFPQVSPILPASNSSIPSLCTETAQNAKPRPVSALFPQGPIAPIDASVSVVIPTYNAGPDFRWLLTKLTTQKGLAHVEIIIIDSGSTDQTCSTARELGCVVHSIATADFSHSFSRNIGAELAKGDYLLFTVQDAYPVGDYWLYALAKVLLEIRVESPSVAAVSCAEFPRSDSELLYDSCVDTHYTFLNCALNDRYGRLVGDDHLCLRKHGQLSDVACFIPRTLFRKYGYSGDYAEDLNLGIRLIRDGYHLGMLSSIKVIHSHNRPPNYHLRRSFTDVFYLTKTFNDFPRPELSSLRGVVSGVAIALEGARRTLSQGPKMSEAPAGYLRRIALECSAQRPVQRSSDVEDVSFGLLPLSAFLKSKVLTDSDGSVASFAEHRAASLATLDLYRAKLEHIALFAERIYPCMDPFLRKELDDAVMKTLAGTFGSQLGFLTSRAENCIVGDLSASAACSLREVLTEGI